MFDVDTKNLIAHLCGGPDPADREAFRRAAENALPSSPRGPGSVYRVLVPLWRSFFRAPTTDPQDEV